MGKRSELGHSSKSEMHYVFEERLKCNMDYDDLVSRCKKECAPQVEHTNLSGELLLLRLASISAQADFLFVFRQIT